MRMCKCTSIHSYQKTRENTPGNVADMRTSRTHPTSKSGHHHETQGKNPRHTRYAWGDSDMRRMTKMTLYTLRISRAVLAPLTRRRYTFSDNRAILQSDLPRTKNRKTYSWKLIRICIRTDEARAEWPHHTSQWILRNTLFFTFFTFFSMYTFLPARLWRISVRWDIEWGESREWWAGPQEWWSNASQVAKWVQQSMTSVLYEDEHWREPTYEAVTLSDSLGGSANNLMVKIHSLRAKWAQKPEDASVLQEQAMLGSLWAKILTILSFSQRQHQVLNIPWNESTGVENGWQTEVHWGVVFPLWTYVSDFNRYLDPILDSIEKMKEGNPENDQDMLDLLRTIESNIDVLEGVLACITEWFVTDSHSATWEIE